MNSIIKKYWLSICSFVLFSIFLSLVEICFAILIKQFIDAISNGDSKRFFWTVLAFLIFLIINYSASILAISVKARVIKKIHIESKLKIFNHILQMDIHSFRQTSSGEKFNIFDYNLEIFEQYYLENIFSASQAIVVLFFVSLYLLYINPLILIAVLVSSIIVPIISLIAGQKIDKLTEYNGILKSNYLYDLKEVFGGFLAIKSFGVEENFKNRFLKKLKAVEENNQELTIKNGVYGQILGISQYVTIIICFCVGGWLVISRQISLGALIAVTQISNMVVQPIQTIGGNFLEIKGSKAIRKELENYTTINPLNASLEYKEIKKISIENVNYKIQGKNILRNINLNLQQGKKYALVGSSGSGKTSILNIIGLLNDEFEGTLEVNDDKRIESRGRYLSQIGYVFQENYLFKGNLRDNLTLYKNYSEEEVKEAIKFAELDSKFTIESYISEEGNNLSGGEKQRIALARAYLSRPSLLLLDEFTSSLDVITTEKINRKITLLKNNIIVLITHKLDGQFLEQFDEIICMENGEIVEKDTFKQLILNKKNFWNLFIKNSSGDENERDIAF